MENLLFRLIHTYISQYIKYAGYLNSYEGMKYEKIEYKNYTNNFVINE